MWVARSFPCLTQASQRATSLGCRFFWNWDDDLSLAPCCPAWDVACLHFSHNTAFSKFCLDGGAGDTPIAKSMLFLSKMLNASKKGSWFFGCKAVRLKMKTTKSEAVWSARGLLLLSGGYNKSTWARDPPRLARLRSLSSFSRFSPTSEDPTECSLQILREDRKNELLRTCCIQLGNSSEVILRCVADVPLHKSKWGLWYTEAL